MHPLLHTSRAALLCAVPSALYFVYGAPKTSVARPVVRPVAAEVTDAGAGPLLAATALRDAGYDPRRAPPPAEHDDNDDDDAGVDDEDAGPFERPTRIMALAIWTPVRAEPRRGAKAVGYLRAGAVVDVVDGPYGRDGCPGRRGVPERGWYKVSNGGYLCVGGASATGHIDEHRPQSQPDLDASMPYPYAINYGRTVMWRHPPTRDEFETYENWHFMANTLEAGRTRNADAEAPGEGDEEPRGHVRLRDLAGERRGPVMRRLLVGMYVALDRTVRDAELGERFWRTQGGGFVRASHVSIRRDFSTFQGTVLDGEAHHLPYAFTFSDQAWLYDLSADHRAVSYSRRLPRQVGVQLADMPPITVNGRVYYATPDGHAVFSGSVRHAVTRPPPDGVGPTERWIDVDLSDQILVAYEGARPVYTTMVSSGRPEPREARDHTETPTGSYRIEAKHVSTTMDGDTASGGPYSIEDVPWVMYFWNSYALHGAFWHGNFGLRMSHGCVNLSPSDARWLFLWVDPQLPSGWHGIYANETQIGSRVEIRRSRRERER